MVLRLGDSCYRPTQVTVVSDHAQEGTYLCRSRWTLEVQDGFYFLVPRFQARRSQPIPQPISFLDTPLAFQRIDGKTIVF